MRAILAIQGLYYLATGIWPLVSLPTFEAVTGPKTDDWLVQTIGVLAAVIGATLIVGSRRRPPNGETTTLSILSASGFALVDTIFVLQGVIDSIYLVDAGAQAIILAALAASAVLRRRTNHNLQGT
jgi:hypothetical protein